MLIGCPQILDNFGRCLVTLPDARGLLLLARLPTRTGIFPLVRQKGKVVMSSPVPICMVVGTCSVYEYVYQEQTEVVRRAVKEEEQKNPVDQHQAANLWRRLDSFPSVTSLPVHSQYEPLLYLDFRKGQPQPLCLRFQGPYQTHPADWTRPTIYHPFPRNASLCPNPIPVSTTGWVTSTPMPTTYPG